MSTFLNLSLLVTPLMILRTLISAAPTFDSSFVVMLHVSDPYRRIGLNIVVYIVVLHCVGMFLSFSSG